MLMKKIVLVGHCGADTSYLLMLLGKIDKRLQVSSADSSAELQEQLNGGVELVLLNRILDYGFDEPEGVEFIRKYSSKYPKTRMMLVSNFPEAHIAAVQAGGVAGFGKREIGQARVTQLLKQILGVELAKV